MKSLLIYDLETSGLRSLDQVLSYAAIRVTMDLEIIEKTSIEIAWRRDMIPSSEAYLVHQIKISGRDTVSEAEGIAKIHRELNQPGTLSGGYNTLGFDDEMLRFSFYRCLLPSYTHQYQNECGRFDILPMVLFYYLYANDVLSWPQIDGKPSFKLELLNQENKWVSGRAHEAMVDVEVTLALMKVLYQRKDIWDYLLGFFDKGEDKKRTYQLLKEEGRYQGLGIMVSLWWGYDRSYQAPVLFLGPHDIYKNQVILLRMDTPLTKLSKSELLMCTVRKKFGEPGFVLPYRSPYKDKLSNVESIVEANLDYLASNLEEIKRICCSQSYEAIEYIDLDAGLYQKGFLSSQEAQWSELFHQALEKSLDSCPTTEVKRQALRYLWRFYPEKIPASYQSEADQSIEAFLTRSVDQRNQPGLRIEEALLQVEKALETTSDKDLRLGLEEIREHIQKVSNILDSISQYTEQK